VAILVIAHIIIGCTTPLNKGSSYDLTQPLGSTFYTSEDYIVYQLQKQDTAASLAEHFLGSTDKSWIIEDANPSSLFQPDRHIIIPLKIRNKGGIYPNGFQQVPILCYHRFDPGCESPLCVPGSVFEKQMQHLKSNGYRVISPKDILAFLDYKQPLPKNAVMITIDDGYRSAYDVAYPILKKYGFTATLFIYTNFVGVSSKAITWDQLKELKTNGFTIGSHTIAHSDLTTQAKDEDESAYHERLRREIIGSKAILDKKLHQDTYFFAYPFGRANMKAMMISHQAGYRLAVTVNRGGNAFFANRFLLRRDQILRRDMTTFARRLKTFHTIPLR
jgi:peptidoglycan/xylan/chitin deacetylase (PgdA/CDA1 family)